MAAPDFWNNQEKAREAIGQLKSLKSILKPMQESLKSADDLPGMLEMANEDDSLAAEIKGEIERLEVVLDELELKALLNGPHDGMGTIMSIHARDGGTDANDWAEMLMNMYLKWGEKNGYDVSVLDRTDNEEAGINSATLSIRGPMAYGYLKGEMGMHRLVRISPFNAEGKRQTSFAAVDVSPEVPDEEEIEIDWDDIRVDTYCSSGAGGQHVNKTESAVRLTHIPTGVVAACQNERSQHQNKAFAFKMLRAKLARLQEEKREAEKDARYRGQAKVGFGSQIRNYFLHPDQRVKDSRTGHSEGSFHKVLDGEIQGLLDSYLRWRVKQDGGVVAHDDDE
jgi:peptide chain release factor 2